MGKNSGVPWTDNSWSPWYGGCEARAPECANCYGKRQMKRFGKNPEALTRGCKTTFRQPLAWREPGLLVFVCPWSDFFLPGADEWRAEAWAIIRATPHLRYIIPTKRPELIPERLPIDWGAGYENVALLVSAGTQGSADRFIPGLLTLPAACRGLSAEPLLEGMDIRDWLDCWHESGGPAGWVPGPSLAWLIVGAESRGCYPGRYCDPGWVEGLVAQADAAGVPVFVKQLHVNGRLSKDPADWPAHLRRQEFPAWAGRGG